MSVAEVVYTTSTEPDEHDARQVLAFVLMPIAPFGTTPGEVTACAAVMNPAKWEIARRWAAGARS